MYAVSQAFLDAVRQNHTIVTRLDVCDLDGTVLGTVSASDGDVSIDSTRSVRRECSFTIPDADGTLTPDAQGDLLSSLSGNELRPYRGVVLPSGATELVPLGVFPIRDGDATLDATGQKLSIKGRDRSTTVSRNRWTAPFSIAASTALEAALTAILADRAPAFAVNFPATGVTVPATAFGLDTQNDPWADAQALATGAGYDLFYDAVGVAQIQKPTDPLTATPILTYADNSLAVIDSMTKNWDADKGYNGCIAIGESSSAPPVNAVVWDDDPTSPTYYRGRYGPYPEFLSSPFITTVEQAAAAAAAQLARRRGVAQNLSWTQVVNPALDANDAITVTSSRLRIPALTVVLDSLTIPWRAESSAQAATRTMQVSA